MSLSKIVVSGQVIKNPEKRFTPNTNVAVTEFAIAVTSPPRQGQKQEATPVKVTTWRDLAERCAQEIKKGDMVAVDGRLQINSFTTSDGQRRKDVEIDAVAVENLSNLSIGEPKGDLQTAGVAKGSAGDDLDAIFSSEDEIPF
ncbi:MAG: single-stranded DNA-binding protein [Candidatus Obscuribacterales bacterium]|nr:single-stranded DNA-binding protein [Candidatus Obscuribacterales bacterium]